MLAVVIMAGGRGERFWPESRLNRPKQFLSLTGSQPMLEQTVERVLPLAPWERVYVVTAAAYEGLVRHTLPHLPTDNLLLEPVGKDTAPCIGWAAQHIAQTWGPDTVLAVLPADHSIQDAPELCRLLSAAVERAHQSSELITLGIQPDRPETGYGYIEYGELNAVVQGRMCYKVKRFVEKPTSQRAQEFLAAGGFLWNSGMFVWRADAILQAIQQHLPEIAAGLRRIQPVSQDGGESLALEYRRLPAISIDYGVMEKASNVCVFPCDISWDDVGSWFALERVLPADEHGNVVVGDHIGVRTGSSVIIGHAGRLIATLGVQDLIVVDAGDVVVVCPKSEAHNIRDLVAELRNKGRQELL
jgi:mannose-1-phosphate guanylyltransferase